MHLLGFHCTLLMLNVWWGNFLVIIFGIYSSLNVWPVHLLRLLGKYDDSFPGCDINLTHAKRQAPARGSTDLGM